MDNNHEKAACLNCETSLNGNFCQKCGQSAHIHRVTFRETINDFFSSTFALEGQLISTIRLLIVNPGKLFREYIAGKRKSYYKPVAFFVVLTAAYIIVRSLINYDPFQGQAAPENVPQARLQFVEAGRFMVANINNILFFLVFSIGISQKIFFYKKYNLAEYLVAGFYICGVYILLGLLVTLFSVYVFWVAPQINMLILFAYLIYGSASLHQKKSFWAIIKYLFSTVMTILLYVILGYGFSFMMVSL